MIGLGTIINTAAVIAGGAVGLLAKKGLKPRFQDILMKACGVPVIFIGISGTLQRMMSINNGAVEMNGAMLIVISMVLGSLLGELIDIEAKVEHLGDKIKNKVGQSGDNSFTEGFMTSSLIICIGAMAIVGSINDGLTGDYSTLAVKAVLDFVLVLVCASTYGVGAVFSAAPLFIYQGLITAIAALCGSFMSERLIANLSMVGNVLIFCVGVNTSFGKKFKTGNMLPAMLGPIVYEIALTFLAK